MKRNSNVFLMEGSKLFGLNDTNDASRYLIFVLMMFLHYAQGPKESSEGLHVCLSIKASDEIREGSVWRKDQTICDCEGTQEW